MLTFPHRSTLLCPFFPLFFCYRSYLPYQYLVKTAIFFFFSSFQPLGTHWKPFRGRSVWVWGNKIRYVVLDCFSINWYFLRRWSMYNMCRNNWVWRWCLWCLWLCDLGIWCVWNQAIMKIDIEYVLKHQFLITLQIREKQRSQTTNWKSNCIWLLLHMQVMLLTLKTISLFRTL